MPPPDVTRLDASQTAVELPDRVYVSSVMGVPARPRTAIRTRRTRHSALAAAAVSAWWRLRDLSERMRAAVDAYDGRMKTEIVRAAEARGRQQAAAEIAAAIRSTRAGEHGDCPGPARCPRCAVNASVDVTSALAEMTGVQR